MAQFELKLPTDNDDKDQWGPKLNAALQAIVVQINTLLTAQATLIGRVDALAPAPVTPVQAAFTFTPATGGTAPLVAYFTDTSTGPVASRAWSFGDGQTDTVQNPSHTFNSPATYTVSLTVTSASGATSTTTRTVTAAGQAAVYASVQIGSASHVIDGTDVDRDLNQLIVYTPRGGTQTLVPSNSYGAEVTVVGGVVTAIRDRINATTDPGPSPIPANGVVLSGHYLAGQWLTANATVGATVAFNVPVATTTPPPTGTTGNLPNKLYGAYWQMYQGPNVSELGTTVANLKYNIQFAAFGLGNGAGGSVSFAPAFQSSASFKSQMNAQQALGCKWLLSLGGGVPASSQVMLRNETEAVQCFNSLVPIIDSFGFDGIDFDLENGPDGWKPAAMASVARKLKAKYGPQFIISIVPRPYESFYYDTAVLMGSDVDLVMFQFYDYNDSASQQTGNPTFLRTWISGKIDEVVGRGIPASKLVIGCITYSGYAAGKWADISVYRSAFAAAEAKYPAMRGMFVWESSLDKLAGYTFAAGAKAEVLS